MLKKIWAFSTYEWNHAQQIGGFVCIFFENVKCAKMIKQTIFYPLYYFI